MDARGRSSASDPASPIFSKKFKYVQACLWKLRLYSLQSTQPWCLIKSVESACFVGPYINYITVWQHFKKLISGLILPPSSATHFAVHATTPLEMAPVDMSMSFCTHSNLDGPPLTLNHSATFKMFGHISWRQLKRLQSNFLRSIPEPAPMRTTWKIDLWLAPQPPKVYTWGFVRDQQTEGDKRLKPSAKSETRNKCWDNSICTRYKNTQCWWRLWCSF